MTMRPRMRPRRLLGKTLVRKRALKSRVPGLGRPPRGKPNPNNKRTPSPGIELRPASPARRKLRSASVPRRVPAFVKKRMWRMTVGTKPRLVNELPVRRLASVLLGSVVPHVGMRVRVMIVMIVTAMTVMVAMTAMIAIAMTAMTATAITTTGRSAAGAMMITIVIAIEKAAAAAAMRIVTVTVTVTGITGTTTTIASPAPQENHQDSDASSLDHFQGR
jgi:hypothetical protein